MLGGLVDLFRFPRKEVLFDCERKQGGKGNPSSPTPAATEPHERFRGEQFRLAERAPNEQFTRAVPGERVRSFGRERPVRWHRFTQSLLVQVAVLLPSHNNGQTELCEKFVNAVWRRFIYREEIPDQEFLGDCVLVCEACASLLAAIPCREGRVRVALMMQIILDPVSNRVPIGIQAVCGPAPEQRVDKKLGNSTHWITGIACSRKKSGDLFRDKGPVGLLKRGAVSSSSWHRV